MNRLFALMICIAALQAGAQSTQNNTTDQQKPAQFAWVPSDTAVPADGRAPRDITGNLQAIFESSVPGDHFSIPVRGGKLKGIVKMRVTKNPFLTFMYLQISNCNNAFLHLTRKKSKDNQIVFYGSVYHPGYSDGLMLTHKQDKYYFISVPQSDIVTD